MPLDRRYGLDAVLRLHLPKEEEERLVVYFLPRSRL